MMEDYSYHENILMIVAENKENQQVEGIGAFEAMMPEVWFEDCKVWGF